MISTYLTDASVPADPPVVESPILFDKNRHYTANTVFTRFI